MRFTLGWSEFPELAHLSRREQRQVVKRGMRRTLLTWRPWAGVFVVVGCLSLGLVLMHRLGLPFLWSGYACVTCCAIPGLLWWSSEMNRGVRSHLRATCDRMNERQQ